MNNFHSITTRNHLSNAFSLVELVMAIAIVAILASVSVISFSNVYSGAQLDNTAHRLLADLELTKQQAIRDQTSYSFEINPTNQYYEAIGVTNLAGTGNIYLNMSQPPYNSTGITLRLIDAGTNIIQFDPWGRVNNYGTILLINGAQNKIITITAQGQMDVTP